MKVQSKVMAEGTQVMEKRHKTQMGVFKEGVSKEMRLERPEDPTSCLIRERRERDPPRQEEPHVAKFKGRATMTEGLCWLK